MTRKYVRKNPHQTTPDHRPMLPEFRQPEDMLDIAVRDVRCRYDEMNPAQKRKWR